MQPKNLLLAALLCLSIPAFSAPAKQELNDIRAAIDSAQNDLKQKQAAHQRAQAALKNSLAALDKARKELAALTQQQNIVWNRLQKLQSELEQVKIEVTGTKAQISRLLTGHYKNRQPNSIALFLKNAEPDRKTRYLEYIKHINQANEHVIQNLIKQQNELETHEHAIDAELSRLKRLKAAKQTVLSKLGKTHSQAQQQSSELNNQIDNQTRKIAALRDDERRLNNLLADIARRRAAGQKAKAQSRKKAAQDRLAGTEKVKPNHPKSQNHTLLTGNLTAEDRSLSGSDQSQSNAFGRMQGRLSRPVSGAISGRFGQARPNGGYWRGLFFSTPPTGVASIAAGTIAYAGSLSGYGNTVVVDHGNSYVSVYTGLGSIAVGNGTHVGAGSTLGTSGSLPSGEQGLYLEIRYRNQPINPLSWLK